MGGEIHCRTHAEPAVDRGKRYDYRRIRGRCDRLPAHNIAGVNQRRVPGQPEIAACGVER